VTRHHRQMRCYAGACSDASPRCRPALSRSFSRRMISASTRRCVRAPASTCGDGTGHERLVAMSIAHLLNLMEDVAYHHVVHQAVRGEPSAALKSRQREALRTSTGSARTTSRCSTAS
jgi:hypothetical protein